MSGKITARIQNAQDSERLPKPDTWNQGDFMKIILKDIIVLKVIFLFFCYPCSTWLIAGEFSAPVEKMAIEQTW